MKVTNLSELSILIQEEEHVIDTKSFSLNLYLSD